MFIWDIQNIEVLNMYSRNLPRENKLRCQSWYRIKYWGNNITRTCFLSDYARWICNEMLYILFIHFNKIKKIRYEASPYIISGKVICLHIFFLECTLVSYRASFSWMSFSCRLRCTWIHIIWKLVCHSILISSEFKRMN